LLKEALSDKHQWSYLGLMDGGRYDIWPKDNAPNDNEPKRKFTVTVQG
jgi:hypothetical protein